MQSSTQKYMTRKDFSQSKMLLMDLNQAFIKTAQTFSSNQDQTHNLIIDSSYSQVLQILSSDSDTQSYRTFVTSRDGEPCLSFRGRPFSCRTTGFLKDLPFKAWQPISMLLPSLPTSSGLFIEQILFSAHCSVRWSIRYWRGEMKRL